MMDTEGRIEVVNARVSGEWRKRVEGHGGRRGGWGTSRRKVVMVVVVRLWLVRLWFWLWL